MTFMTFLVPVTYQEKDNGKPDFKKMTYDMENVEDQDEQQSQKQAQAAMVAAD